jgi:hypothetical protein
MAGVAPKQTNLVLLVRRGAGGKAYWDARWRFRMSDAEPWRLIQRRLGLAWQEQSESGQWQKRRGRCPDGWLDERSATGAALAAMEEQERELEAGVRQRREASEQKLTVCELAADWLVWLEEVKGAKPSTVADYRFLLREPGIPYRRGNRKSAGRIMAAFGDRAAAEVTTADVSAFLRALDREGLSLAM